VQPARLALVLCLAACAPAGERASRALYELERLTFVPPARCSLVEYSPPPYADCSLERALVFDRFELTRGDVAFYWPEFARAVDARLWSDAARDAPERADWPAFLDFAGAGRVAQARGMRLPTPREWIHVAVGRRDFSVPWGGRGQELFANTRVLLPDEYGQRVDSSLKSPCRVGTFENGRSRPFGCYDLLGNVWEWVDGVVPGLDPPLEDEGDVYDFGGRSASVMGGAYNTPLYPTFWRDPTRGSLWLRFHAKKMDKDTLSPAIGARMCAEAEPYLWSQAAHWDAGSEPATRRRVARVGREWAEDARSREALEGILSGLCARPGAAPALAWLAEGVRSAP